MQLKNAVENFQQFLSNHMYILANTSHENEVLQLALLQPEESKLHSQAISIIKEKKENLWLKWKYVRLGSISNFQLMPITKTCRIINEEMNYGKCVLHVSVHSEGVSCCQFLKDGDKVLSCGGTEVKASNNKTLKLVKSSFIA